MNCCYARSAAITTCLQSIKDLLKYNDSFGTLRSSNNRLLDEPRANLTTYGERAFSVAAPRLWNKLPLKIRLSSSEAVFKATL